MTSAPRPLLVDLRALALWSAPSPPPGLALRVASSWAAETAAAARVRRRARLRTWSGVAVSLAATALYLVVAGALAR